MEEGAFGGGDDAEENEASGIGDEAEDEMELLAEEHGVG